MIIQRWQNQTGRQAILDGHGATFEYVKEGRRLEAEDAIKEEVFAARRRGPRKGRRAGRVIGKGGRLMPNGGRRPGAGRKAIPIDPAEMFKLAAIHCTIEDMAGWFGVTEKTIDRRIRSKKLYHFTLVKLDPAGAPERSGTLAEIIQQGMAVARVSLRRKLHAMADKRPAAAIFLAKNLLGYKDARSVEIGGIADAVGNPSGAPIQIVISPDESKI